MKTKAMFPFVEYAVEQIFGERLRSLARCVAQAAEARIQEEYASFLAATANMPEDWFCGTTGVSCPEYITGVRYDSRLGGTIRGQFRGYVALPYQRVPACFKGRVTSPAPLDRQACDLAKEITQFIDMVTALLAPYATIKQVLKKYPEYSELFPPQSEPSACPRVPAVILTSLSHYLGGK